MTGLFRWLSDLAARRHLALLVVWRLENKARGGSARALEILRDAADVVWLVAGDSCPSGNRLLTCVQNQLGRLAGNLAFSVENDGLTWRAADARTTADEVVASWPRTADRPERRQAAAWLLEMLSHGPIEAQRLFDECRQCQLSQRTVRRAAAELGLHPIKIGQSGPWLWGFDKGAAIEPQGVQEVAALPEAGNLADSAVVQVELRSDAAPTVATFEPFGNLPNSADLAPDAPDNPAAPNVATFESIGNLPSSADLAPDVPDNPAAPNVATFEPVGNLPSSAEPESNLILPVDDDADDFDNLVLDERPRRKGRLTAQQRRDKRRRERQALEEFMDIIREG